MSVVDAPPGLDFAGPAAGEFRARPRSRRLSRVVFIVVFLDSIGAMSLVTRKFHAPGSTMLIVGPLTCLCLAGVGLAVRSARIQVDAGGLRWGWTNIGGRMGLSRIKAIHYYESAVAVLAKRGSTWYLSRGDWDKFEDFPQAFKKAGIEIERKKGRPPLKARLQAYGVVLDGLLLLTLLFSGFLLLFGAVR